MIESKLRKFLLMGCVVFSVCIHGGLIFLFFKTPLFLRQRLASLWFKTSDKPELMLTSSPEEFQTKINKALEESFNKVIATKIDRPTIRELQEEEIAEASPQENDPSEEISADFPDDDEEIAQESDESNERESQKEEIAALPSDFASEESEPELEEDVLFQMDSDKDPFATQNYTNSEDLDFAQELRALKKSPESKELVDDFSIQKPVESFLATPKERSKETSLPQFLKKHYRGEVVEEPSDDLKYDEIPNSKPAYALTNPGEYLREEWTNSSIVESKLPDIEYYGLAEIANSFLWEEEVHVDVSYLPDTENHKYIFSLTVNPDFDVEAEPLQQNFYFIIDRSNSIKKQRFNSYKRAVQRALSALQEGDKFNIYILDKSVSRLSEKNLFFSAKNIKLAEEFLEKEDYKPFFSGNDLYTSLERIFPIAQTPDELHSAILISDGNTLLSSAKQKKAVLSWTEKNKGNVNIYAATSGQGNNLVLLDLLSYTTSGKLLYSDTNASFPRKLVKFVKDLHDPIVKEVSLDASAADPGNTVVLYPKKTLLSPIHTKKPFVVVGTIDDLEDFTLYIQGKNRGRWLNIKKNISFKDASKGGRSLEKLWAYTQANVCYDQFLKEGKSSHLKEAKKVLTPYKAVICLE